MKNKGILALISLGIIWFFLKQKKALTSGVKLGGATPSFPSPGLYFAELVPLTTVAPAVVIPEKVEKKEVVILKSMADIMEAIIEAAKREA